MGEDTGIGVMNVLVLPVQVCTLFGSGVSNHVMLRSECSSDSDEVHSQLFFQHENDGQIRRKNSGIVHFVTRSIFSDNSSERTGRIP